MGIEIGAKNLYKAYGVPALDLTFADKKSLVDRISGNNLITFTRFSVGTYVGADGLIKSAAVNEPRFDHDPATGESLGLLVEEARTNSCIRSETFTSSPFTLEAATATKDQVDPTGSSNATKITLSAGTASHRIRERISSARVCRSFYVKKTNCRYVYILDNNGGYYGPSYKIDLDLGTITLIRNSNGSYPNFGFSIFNAGNGFYRVWFDAVQVDYWAIYPSNTNYNVGVSIPVTFAADGTESFIIWGYQVEATAPATSYIPTSGSTVTRAADVASITGTNFSSWYRQDEGTWFANILKPAGVANSRIINTGVNLWSGPTNAGYVRTGSSAVLLTTSYPVKVSAKYNNSSLTGAVNGTLLTEAGGVNVTATYLDIGSANTAAAGVGFLNNPIARLTYYPVRLPDATLQALTQ